MVNLATLFSGPSPAAARLGGPSPARRRLGVLIALLSVTTFLSGVVATGSVEAATTCPALVPQLRDVTVNQGVGSYPVLVRGKETLVRAYLSLPQCTARGASIAVTGATLTVSNGSTPLTASPIPAYSPTTSTTPPTLAPYIGAAALNAPADAMFVVPPAAMAPAGVTSRFTATFAVTIRYTTNAGTAGSVTFTTRPGTTAPITATVEKPTKALRVLVVPMGNSTQLATDQFSSAARTATVDGMTTLSRILPVPSGTGDLINGTGGIRYTIDPTLLALDRVTGALTGPNGTFCGTSANFDAVKGQLATFLQAWNTANPNSPADRVLGVVSGASTVSSGSSSGCAEGMAAPGGTQAWVRATPATATAPSITGSLMAMELSHTMGVVPKSRADAYSPYHSVATQADGSAPDRGYNVTLRSYLADDHTAMTYVGTWNDTNTLMEPADWAMMLCQLGGATTTDCTTPGVVGTSAGVGANPTFVISGTTDGSQSATHVVESYFAAGIARSFPVSATLVQPQVDTNYFLAQYAGNRLLRSDRVAVSLADSDHDQTGPPTVNTDVGSFSTAVEWLTATTEVRLVRGTPGAAGSTVLYTRQKIAPPTVSVPVVSAPGGDPTLRNLTDTPSSDEYETALSPDGQLVAYVTDFGEGGQLVSVASVADPSNPVDVQSAGGSGASTSTPSWGGPDGHTLVFEDDTAISSAHFVLDDGVVVTDRFPQLVTGDLGDPYTSLYSPVLSPDGTTLAYLVFDESGVRAQLYTMPFDGSAPATAVPEVTDATALSWSRTPGDNRLAYTVLNTDTNQYDLYVFDPSTGPNPQILPKRIAQDAMDPSWGTDGRIAFRQEGSIQTILADGTGQTRVTDSVSDSYPSIAGPLVAFSRRLTDPGGGGDQNDIMILEPGAGDPTHPAVSFTATSPDPSRLTADLIYTCGGVNYPVVVGAEPTSLTGTQATFELVASTSETCTGGTFSVAVNDGVSRVTTAPVDTPSTPAPPAAAITAPSPAQQVLQFDPIPLRGAGKDAEDGELTDLTWTMTTPGGSTSRVGSGPEVDLSAPSNGWAPGSYTFMLTARDSSGRTDTDQRTVTVLADSDHNGLPDGLSTSSCPLTDAFADADGDGILNLDDYTLTGKPCVAATSYSATAVFNPDPLPLTSTGNPVTIYVRIPYRDPASVNPSTVQISQVEGRATAFKATAWTVSSGVATAKFDRQKLISYLNAQHLTGRRVAFRVTGTATGGAWSFAADTTTQVGN